MASSSKQDVGIYACGRATDIVHSITFVKIFAFHVTQCTLIDTFMFAYMNSSLTVLWKIHWMVHITIDSVFW